MPAPVAGSKVRGSDAANYWTYNELVAQASADQTVTTTQTDVTSATITFTTPVANTKIRWMSVFRVTSSGSADVFAGMVVLDGVAQSRQAVWSGTGSTTVSQTDVVTIATAGAHTIKLAIIKFGTANTVTMIAAPTGLAIGGQGIV